VLNRKSRGNQSLFPAVSRQAQFSRSCRSGREGRKLRLVNKRAAYATAAGLRLPHNVSPMLIGF
jgi:hypothetical protein